MMSEFMIYNIMLTLDTSFQNNLEIVIELKRDPKHTVL